MAARGFDTLRWDGDSLVILDQTLLPGAEVYLRLSTVEAVAEAIRVLRVRGAPAIGCAAAYGLCVAAARSEATDPSALQAELEDAARVLAATRPTAVNLFWALERMLAAARSCDASPDGLRERLLAEADAVFHEDDAACRLLGRLGAELVPDGAGILTHCNAGGLATSGYGTAVGVIRAAHEDGKRIHVYADETRPLLQGARLTAWELKTLGIPATLLCDNMAASHLASGRISLAVVGADRIASNGDTANKIGTLGVAVLCQHFGVPFYVAAPTSTLDLSLASGTEIPIEERNADEVRALGGTPVAPAVGGSFDVANPAFDVTPAALISAIITEKGIARPPYAAALAGLARSAGA
jgi:methylthioribose-1-phosphate isomerase